MRVSFSNFMNRKVTEESIISVQIFDQKKFKKKDQGFLGVINVRVSDVLNLAVGGEGQKSSLTLSIYLGSRLTS